ncbi:hypothetical protein NKH77_27655 [Streptomyces sp. M19]
MPKTSSPTATPVTPSPTSSTTPAASNPVRYGNVTGTVSRSRPERRYVSPGRPGGPYGDTDLARPGVRRRHLGDVQDARRAVLGELECSHAGRP